MGSGLGVSLVVWGFRGGHIGPFQTHFGVSLEVLQRYVGLVWGRVLGLVW